MYCITSVTSITTLPTVQIDQISGVIREEGDKRELSLQLKFFDKMQRSLKTELKEGLYSWGDPYNYESLYHVYAYLQVMMGML